MVLQLSSMIEVVPVQVDGEDNSSWLDVHAGVYDVDEAWFTSGEFGST